MYIKVVSKVVGILACLTTFIFFYAMVPDSNMTTNQVILSWIGVGIISTVIFVVSYLAIQKKFTTGMLLFIPGILLGLLGPIATIFFMFLIAMIGNDGKGHGPVCPDH